MAGGGPGLSEIAYGPSVSVEHESGDSNVPALFEQPSLPATVNQLGQITFEHDRTAPAGLGGLGSEPNRAAVSVHVGPPQGDDLALAPAGEVGEPGEVLQVGG